MTKRKERRSLVPVIEYLERQARAMIPAEYQPDHLVVNVERQNRRTREAWSDRKVWADLEAFVEAAMDAEDGAVPDPEGSVTQITVAAEILADVSQVRGVLVHEVGHHVVGDPTTKRDRCKDDKKHPSLEAAIKAVGKADAKLDWSGYAEVVVLLPLVVKDDEDAAEEGGNGKQADTFTPSGRRKHYSLSKVLCLGCGGWARVSTAKPSAVACANTGCTHQGQPMKLIGRTP